MYIASASGGGTFNLIPGNVACSKFLPLVIKMCTSSIAIKLSLPLSHNDLIIFSLFSGYDIHSGMTNIILSLLSAGSDLSSTVLSG